MVMEFATSAESYTIFDSFKRSLIKPKPKEWIDLSEKDKALAILREVSTVFNIPIEQLAGKSRKREIVIPRQIYCYIARRITGAALREIGENLGGRDHTTVIHANHAIADLIYTNDEFMNYWDRYKQNARSHLIP